MKDRRIVAAVVVLVLAFGWLIWPTAYETSSMKIGSGQFPVKINRFTGTTWVLRPEGWVVMRASTP